MKNYTLITVLFTASLLFSCTKKDATQNINLTTRSIADIILNYQAFSQKKVDGAFYVQSMAFNNQPAEFTTTTQIGGAFYTKKGDTRAGGIVSIGSYNLLPSINNFYGFDKYLSRDDFYGKKITFRLNPKPSLNSGTTRSTSLDDPNDESIVSQDLYIPSAINVGTSNSSADPTNYISWNPDPLNPNGIVIIAEYNPDLTLNEGLSNAGYSSLIRNSISVPDNGGTTLSTDFYSMFPSGAKIILYVGRGNYTIISSGNYDYSIAAYTENSIYIVTKP